MNCVLRNGFGRFFNDTEGLSICQGLCDVIAMPPSSCCDNILSNEKNIAWLGLYGIILPSYMGIVINHYKDPY